MSETIDVDELLPRIENLGGVASRAEVADAIRWLRARCYRLQATVEDTARSLTVVLDELEKAAVEMAAERQRAEKAEAECERLRSCAHGAIAEDYDAACELVYGSGYNQLAKRVAELVTERDWLREYSDELNTINEQQQPEVDRLRLKTVELNRENVRRAEEIERMRAELADANHRVEAVVQGEFMYVAKSEWEWLRAERPTMERLKEAAVGWLKDYAFDVFAENNPPIVRYVAETLPSEGSFADKLFIRHFSPLAAEGNDQKVCQECGHWWYEPGTEEHWLKDDCPWCYLDSLDADEREELIELRKTVLEQEYKIANAEIEGLRAERPTMEKLRAALGRFLSTIDAFNRHFAPLAADAEKPESEHTYRAKYDPLTGNPQCERCGNSMARLCPQCDAAETFDAPDREDRAVDSLIVAAIRGVDPGKITPHPQCGRCGKPSTYSVKGDGCDWWFCDECRPPVADEKHTTEARAKAEIEAHKFRPDAPNQPVDKPSNPPAIPESSERTKYDSVPEMLHAIADDIRREAERENEWSRQKAEQDRIDAEHRDVDMRRGEERR